MKPGRKHTKMVSANIFPSSSSAESDDALMTQEESRQVTLHVITDPGQSASVDLSFQQIVGCLDSSLGVINVSERFRPLELSKSKSTTNEHKIPALAVVLFFREDYQLDNDNYSVTRNNYEDRSVGLNNENHFTHNDQKSNEVGKFIDISKVFSKKCWRFHHKVAVTGKLISCKNNKQEFYEFIPSFSSVFGSRRKTLPEVKNDSGPSNSTPRFPLWGIRKVHYGKQILRFTLFVTNENWTDQVSLYKLILRREEVKVRDDFCFFETFSNNTTIVQLGLKKLPVNLKPQPLSSSILQFKVKNVGQLVPLLPHSCDPISELRWRTRDHDSNLILLQIYRTRGVTVSSSFVQKVFKNQRSSENEKSELSAENSTCTHDLNFPSKTKTKGILRRIVKSKQLYSEEINREWLDSDGLGDSFVCPSLPERMPLLEPIVYFQPTCRVSSSSFSSTASSSGHQTLGTTSSSGDQSAERTSPKLNVKTTRSNKYSSQKVTFALKSASDENSSSKSVTIGRDSHDNFLQVTTPSHEDEFYV